VITPYYLILDKIVVLLETNKLWIVPYPN